MKKIIQLCMSLLLILVCFPFSGLTTIHSEGEGTDTESCWMYYLTIRDSQNSKPNLYKKVYRVGETGQMSVFRYCSITEGTPLKWFSTDPNVVSINEGDGTFEVLSVGEATLYCTTADNTSTRLDYYNVEARESRESNLIGYVHYTDGSVDDRALYDSLFFDVYNLENPVNGYYMTPDHALGVSMRSDQYARVTIDTGKVFSLADIPQGCEGINKPRECGYLTNSFEITPEDLEVSSSAVVFALLLGEQEYEDIIAGNKQPFTINIELSSEPFTDNGRSSGIISEIIVPDINIFEGYYDEHGNDIDGYYNRYDSEIFSREVTVVMTDGTEYTDHFSQILRYIANDYGQSFGDYSIDDGQDINNQWGVGQHEVTLTLNNGFETKYNVNIVESPIQSITVNSVVPIIEGSLIGRVVDNEGVYSVYAPTLPESMTFRMKDGKEYTGSLHGFNDFLLENYNFNMHYDYKSSIAGFEEQTRDNLWKVGDVHTCTLTFMGMQVPFETKVISPIKSLIVEDITVLTKQDSEFGIASAPWPKHVKAIMDTGDEIEGELHEVVLRIERYVGGTIVDFDAFFNPSTENNWSVGDHTATLRIGAKTADYTVHAIENPIKNITVEDVTMLEGDKQRNYSYYNDELGEYENYNIYYPEFLNITLETNDNQTISFDHPNQLTEWLSNTYQVVFNYDIDLGQDMGLNSVWDVGQHNALLRLFSPSTEHEYPFNITVVEDKIAAVTVKPLTLYEGVSMQTMYGEYSPFGTPTYEIYDATPTNIHVAMKDGKMYDGHPWDVSILIKQDYNIELTWVVTNDQMVNESAWSLGNHTSTFRIGAHEVDYNVTLQKNPVTIEVSDYKVFKDDPGYLYDSDTYEVFYGSFRPRTLTVKYNNKTYSGTYEQVFTQLFNNHNLYLTSSSTYNERMPMNVSDVYLGFINVDGDKIQGQIYKNVNIEVIENPIQSIEVEDIQVRYSHDHLMYYYGPNDNGTVNGLESVLNLTIRTKDGDVLSGKLSAINEQLFNKYGAQIQQAFVEIPELDPDEASGTVKVTLRLAGLEKEFNMHYEEASDAIPVAKGKSITLKSPFKGTTWTSNNGNIAKVNMFGRVTGVDYGMTSVTARGNTGETETFNIEVLPGTTELVIDYTLPDESTDIYEGFTGKTVSLETDHVHLIAHPQPFGASDKVTWTSSNTKVATIDPENGEVTRVSNGTVTFTAKAIDGTGKAASITIKFVNFVKDLEIDGPNEVAKGKSITLKATMNDDATTKTVTWTSSDPKIAKVDAKSGKVTGVNTSGEPVTITATTTDGSGTYAEYDVMVLPPATSVVIEDEDGNIITGKTKTLEAESIQLFAYTNPANASDSVKWTSNNTKVATVDPETGEVTRVNNGTAVITATTLDGTGKKATATLKFVYFVDELDITGPTEVGKGKSITLKAIPNADATNKAVKWTSSNSKIAKVDAKTGKVTGVAEGSVTITATAQDGSGFDANYEVNVLPPATKVIIENNLSENITGKTITIESDTYDLYGYTSPDAASDAIRWTSGNAKIATVDPETGEVTRVKNGKVTITGTALDGSGKKASVTLNFVTYVHTLYITGPSEVGKGKSVTLKAVPNSDATNKTVKWTSSNPSIAKVDAKTGKVTGVNTSDETVTITATATDRNEVKASYAVSVLPPATSVVIEDEGGNVITGKTTTLEADSIHLFAYSNPEGASDDVSWSSSNTKIATVDAVTGEVTRIKNGTVTIIATAQDGSGKKATTKLTFVTLVKNIEIDGPGVVAKGKTVTFKATTNADATNKTVTWRSSNPSVAKVDAKTGKVTGVNMGSVVIYATANDGSKVEVEHKITILLPVSALKIHYNKDASDTTGDASGNATGTTVITEASTIQLLAKRETLASSSEVKWTSSNTNIATVDPNTGLVTKVKDGTVTITATSTDGTGKKATANVRFLRYVSSIEIIGPTEVAKGKKITLKAVVNSDATNKAVTWTSSDKKIAKIDSTGKVTGIKPGTVTIQAVAKDGSGVVDEYTIVVK